MPPVAPQPVAVPRRSARRVLPLFSSRGTATDAVPTRDARSAVPQRTSSRRASVVPAPDTLPQIRTRPAPSERGASADRSGRAAADDLDGEATPEAPATAAKRVAPRLPRTSSAVFSVGSVPAELFKPHRAASGAVQVPPADEPPREVLPGTAELLRARSLRAPPPAQGGKLRSALRAINAIATPRVLWKHGRAQQDAAQAKENGLAR